MKKPAPSTTARKPAPAKKAAPVRRPQARRRSSSAGQQLLLAAVSAVLLIAALPTALLLAFAMLPAFCALITDRSPIRSATICVGALNLAGSWPFLLMLWTRGHTVVNAMQIAFDPYAWLVIYCSAGVGWLLYLSCPSLVAATMSMFAGHRLVQLRQQQKNLVAEWGNEVSTGHPRRNA